MLNSKYNLPHSQPFIKFDKDMNSKMLTEHFIKST